MTAVAAIFAALGAFVAGAASYLALLAVAACFYHGYRRRKPSRPVPSTRLVILIPAHNEADFIVRCVRSLKDQTYPEGLLEIVVVADNCTDDTAALARSAGAEVLVRTAPEARGKGQALRWALDEVLARPRSPEGIVVVDADSVVDRQFVATLVVPLEDGADAVQGESLMFQQSSPQAALRGAAFLLMNRVRPSARAVLRLPCNLAGNGMLLSRRVLVAHPWSAFSSAEDLEYSIRLRMQGVRPVFAGGALIFSPVVSDHKAAEQQRLRWEGGKFHVARKWIPRLVARALRTGDISLLEAAVDLAVPPLGLLVGGVALGTLVGVPLVWADFLPGWALWPWLVACLAIPIYVIVGLQAAHAPASAYRALVRAPAFVLEKVLRSHRLLRFRADTWVRAERPSEAAARHRGAPKEGRTRGRGDHPGEST